MYRQAAFGDAVGQEAEHPVAPGEALRRGDRRFVQRAGGRREEGGERGRIVEQDLRFWTEAVRVAQFMPE